VHTTNKRANRAFGMKARRELEKQEESKENGNRRGRSGPAR